MFPFYFFLIHFLSFSSILFAQNDESTLLKLKEQLGNPIELKSWVSGSDYCKSWSDRPSFISSSIWCTSNGRVSTLSLRFINANTTFPSAIFDLTELENLNVYAIEGLHGQIPDGFATLHQLKYLEITFTSLSGPIPSSLMQTNLSFLVMNDNKLFGPIPESLSKLKYLSWLDLSSNQLSGPIPPELVHGSPSDSIRLNLGFNDLSGELPKYYGGPYFEEINLMYNRLSGDASFLFGKEKETLRLYLSHNNFEFDLTHVEASNRLSLLDISYNRIWGNIPQSLEDIGWIDLSNNQLCGPIPTGNYSWHHPAEVYENNSCLCGGLLPPCCD